MRVFARILPAIHTSMMLFAAFGFSSKSIAQGVAAPTGVPGQSGATPTAGVSATKSPRADVGAFSPGGGPYSTVEIRHHVNSYYDSEGYLARREPSLHARMQLGMQLYAGMVDMYGTFGIYKLASTQQVLQRRPELAVDLYPVRNTFFTLLQYNLIQLPYRKPDAQSQKEEMETTTEEEKAGDTVDGSIYTIGFAPTVKLPILVGSSILEFRTGFDAWTRLYSQRQYTGLSSSPDESDDDEGHLGIVDANGSRGASDQPIEDYAMHYQTQYLGGVALHAGFLPGFSTEMTVNSNSRFDPRYTRNEDGGVEYKYAADRYSYYRWRFQYEISPRISIINDFYHFHDGFFEAERKGDERRFRNIARITCRL